VIADSLVWANWLVALGTLALAVATGVLAFFTFRATRDSANELKLERRRLEEAQRPIVFPFAPSDWAAGTGHYQLARYIPLKNGGPSIALNVGGGITFPPTRRFPGAATISFAKAQLAPGDEQDILMIWPPTPSETANKRTREQETVWDTVQGHVDFDDLAGGRWQTVFNIHVEEGRIIDVQPPKPVTGSSPDTAAS
jgi:hypothetical protein